MNIIRTKVMELSTIPAVAYKLKLASGGSGIKMYRTDCDETAFAVIDKRTATPLVDARTNVALFPDAAFDEAIDMLAGLPYSARGKVKIVVCDEPDTEDICLQDDQKNLTTACMVDSDEFNAIIDRYSDEHGKINYALMNKQFMQFAQTSKVVGEMVGNKESESAIRLFILKNRAAHLANKREHLSDDEAAMLLEALDEIDPRSAFKELTLYLRKRMAR